MSIKVIVGGKQYQLDEATKSIMELFTEADALQQINQNKPFPINTIDEKTWTQVLELCKIANNNFPEVSKIKSDNLNEAITNNAALTEALAKKSPEQINQLYRAAQNLKITNLKKCIAAALACRVYIKPTLEEYNNKRAQLNIKEPLTAEQSRKMKETYPFMN